jgi:K+-transporting ATPase ATPase A chain
MKTQFFQHVHVARVHHRDHLPSMDSEAVTWDIAPGLVMLFSRFLPIVVPIDMADNFGGKKSAPIGPETLHDDTPTFGFLLLGTILTIGASLFLPVAALGLLAEHLGPIPLGGCRSPMDVIRIKS